jgi:oxygen-dependent protoporphyrinogen oxidase
MPEVIIIGAGITGLSCAWRLKRSGIETLLLESSGRAGGVIQTQKIDGYLVEWGPNTLLPTPETFSLLDECGLTPHLISGDPRAPRYICIGEELRRVPFGALGFRGLLRALCEPFVRSRSPQNESVQEFFSRRFGREAQDRLVAPFVTGIYAGDTRVLGMRGTFPKLVDLEQQYGSLVWGTWKTRKLKSSRRNRTSSFTEGMEMLPRRLAEDVTIQYDVRDVHIESTLQVTWSLGRVQPRAVVITAPAYSTSSIFDDTYRNIVRLLDTIEYAPIMIAATSVPISAFSKTLRGFGFLAPPSEQLHVLGTLFSSSMFPGRAPRNRALLTSFVGGTLRPETIDWPDSHVWDILCPELQRILKISVSPDPVALIRHRDAIPQYKIGHERWRAELRKELSYTPGLFLAGNYLDGVSVSSCIESGERTAREVKQFLRSKK